MGVARNSVDSVTELDSAEEPRFIVHAENDQFKIIFLRDGEDFLKRHTTPNEHPQMVVSRDAVVFAEAKKAFSCGWGRFETYLVVFGRRRDNMKQTETCGVTAKDEGVPERGLRGG
jgi:hypothetical protein